MSSKICYPDGYPAGKKLEMYIIHGVETGELIEGTPILATAALAKQFNISPQTAQIVLRSLAERGYLVRHCGSRTTIGRAPGKKRKSKNAPGTTNGMIGVLMPNLEINLTPKKSPTHYEILNGVMSGMAGRDWPIKVFQNHRQVLDLSTKKLNDFLGFVLVFPRLDDLSLLLTLRSTEIPLVLINWPPHETAEPVDTAFHTVNFGYKLAVQAAIKAMKKDGAAKIAYVSAKGYNLAEKPFFDKLKLKQIELEMKEEPGRSGKMERGFDALLKRELAAVDAVICANTAMGNHIAGLVPSKKVISILDFRLKTPLHNTAWFSADNFQFGVKAAEILVKCIGHDVEEPFSEFVVPELVEADK